MNAGILPMALLSAAFGVTLSFASCRGAWLAVAALVVAAVVVAGTALPGALGGAVFTGAWLSVIATAALAFVPWPLRDGWAIAAGINGGGWLGALASLSPRPGGLIFVLPLALSFLAGQWLNARGHAIVPKVVLSWIVAIASLSFFVSLLPTPGYQPDHME
jgi:hypothetical protein